MGSKSNNLAGNLVSSNAVGIYANGACTGTVIKTAGVTNNTVNFETNTSTGIIYK